MLTPLPPPRIYISFCDDPSPINQICTVSLKSNISEPELWKIVSFFVNWLNYNSKRQLVAKCQTWQLSTTLNSNFQISQASRNYFSELHCIDSKAMLKRLPTCGCRRGYAFAWKKGDFINREERDNVRECF